MSLYHWPGDSGGVHGLGEILGQQSYGLLDVILVFYLLQGVFNLLR
jgi:hypothetical protein